MTTRFLAAVLTALALAQPETVLAGAVDDLLARYRGAGGASFSADAGKALWMRTFHDAATGQARNCASCHGPDLRVAGTHATTGKPIEPLAPSANPKRLTDAATIEKWLGRNCTWTLGRPCTPQEKGDLLLYLRAQ
jgi:hypothetical protein